MRVKFPEFTMRLSCSARGGELVDRGRRPHCGQAEVSIGLRTEDVGGYEKDEGNGLRIVTSAISDPCDNPPVHDLLKNCAPHKTAH
jgi:hypothetical protein